MASLKDRVICYHAHVGYKTRIFKSTGLVPSHEYADLPKQPNVDAYIMADHVLWVDRNRMDNSGFPECTLMRVFKQGGQTPTIQIEDKFITDINDGYPAREATEQIFEDVFGRNLVRVNLELDGGLMLPVSDSFLRTLKLDELIHSAIVIKRDYSYIRINYVDGGHMLYLVPVGADIDAAL